eukprot:9325-Heterococcus_DN1.PRE.3
MQSERVLEYAILVAAALDEHMQLRRLYMSPQRRDVLLFLRELFAMAKTLPQTARDAFYRYLWHERLFAVVASTVSLQQRIALCCYSERTAVVRQSSLHSCVPFFDALVMVLADSRADAAERTACMEVLLH